MFEPGDHLFTPAGAAAADVAAIERAIIRCLAERHDRGVDELEAELRAADGDLPVDATQLAPILAALEHEFAVSLAVRHGARVSYVHELAMLIQRQLAAAREPVDPERGEPSSRASSSRPARRLRPRGGAYGATWRPRRR